MVGATARAGRQAARVPWPPAPRGARIAASLPSPFQAPSPASRAAPTARFCSPLARGVPLSPAANVLPALSGVVHQPERASFDTAPHTQHEPEIP
jgi:hypothetical protein